MAAAGSPVKFAPQPQIFRMWARTPHWGYHTGTWSQWPGYSPLDFLFPRGIEGVLPILFWGRTSPWAHNPSAKTMQCEGGTSSKDYKCLTEGCAMQLTNKESACSHIWASQSHIGFFCSWVGLEGCCPCPNPFQNWEAFRKHLGSVHSAGLDTSYACEHSEVK